jgi:pimeloyl-ACP methyl ester carboxylesterase
MGIRSFLTSLLSPPQPDQRTEAAPVSIPPAPAPTYADRTWVSDDGLRLYARDYAGAAGEAKLPIFCLHGLTRNSADFEDVAPYLTATGRRVIVPDTRGRGRSAYDPNPMNYHPWTYAGDLIKLADALGIQQAHFIGTSMGGLMTMVLATLRPTLIRSSVLNDVGPYLQAPALARIANYGGIAAGPYDTWAEATAYAKKLNGVAFPHNSDADWMAFAKRLFQQGADGKIRLAYDPAIFDIFKTVGANAPAFDMSVQYSALAAGRKITLVRGAISELLASSDADRMQALSGNFTRVEIADIGHAPMLSEPDAKAAIEAHLSDQA